MNVVLGALELGRGSRTRCNLFNNLSMDGEKKRKDEHKNALSDCLLLKTWLYQINAPNQMLHVRNLIKLGTKTSCG